MIKNLQIQNYAIIESLDLNLDKGLTAITGETGAGKSILLGALGLVLGKRADTKVLYEEDKKCIVEATFDIKDYNLQDFFEANDLEYQDETIIRRTISPAGKSRAFVNDEPTNLSVLKLLNEHLLELHQQFDTQDIQQNLQQIQIIDAIAGNQNSKKEYTALFKEYSLLKKKLEDLRTRQALSAKEHDFLNFQLEELQTASLVDGEQEEKESELKILESVEDIQNISKMSTDIILESDQNILDKLQLISNELYGLQKINKDIAEVYERVNSTIEELKDIEQEVRNIADIDYDQEKLVLYRERLDMIYRLQKKHNVNSLIELLSVQSDLETQLSGLNDLSSEILNIEQNIERLETQLLALAKKISNARKNHLASFEQEIKTLLSSLAMPNAVLLVDINTGDKLLPTGIDELKFLFASNKGSKPQEIKDVASGGEISRLALCLKSLVADAMTMPTLIFDEIDSGVSGDVASKMGSILQQLAKNHQLITITHSPQIASKANEHYFVFKQDTEDRTISDIVKLDTDRRVLEIAKMLSSDPPPPVAIANAKQLLSI